MTPARRFSAKSRRDGGVGADHALGGGVRDVALVPEGDVLHGGQRIGAHHAREAGDVLGQHRIALVGHGGGALLPFREELLGFENLGALEVADLDGEPLDGRGDDAEGGEVHGVPVAGDDLR